MLDYPKVRSGDVCPLCKQRKDSGLVACWQCYHARGLRYWNAEAEDLIREAEEELSENTETDSVETHQ